MESTETQKDTMEEQQIKSLWTALQVAERQTEKRGIQFGEAVYKLRERYKIQGTRNDLSSDGDKSEGYLSVLSRLGIPEATARRWRDRYEESIGTRLPKPNPDNRPSEMTPPEVEAEPTEQASSRDVSPSDGSPSADDISLPESEPEPRPQVPTPGYFITSTAVPLGSTAIVGACSGSGRTTTTTECINA